MSNKDTKTQLDAELGLTKTKTWMTPRRGIPRFLQKKQGLALTSDVVDWQVNHGSLLKRISLDTRIPEDPSECYSVGVTVFPTLFPRAQFNRACELQPVYSELYCAIADDEEWLLEAIHDLLPVDPLLQLSPGTESSLGAVERSDILLKQVEFNTFSCAGVTYATKVAEMHRYLARAGAYESGDEGPLPITLKSLPRRNNVESLADCLASAHEAYGPRSTAVLFVVQPDNFNIADERPIEYASFSSTRYGWGSKTVEISVAYMRADYEAHEYGDAGKEARLRIELSRAIRCPFMLSHICTFKKVQCVLTAPEALERFLLQEKADIIRSTFVPMYPLDNSDSGAYARQLATDRKLSRDYMKPSLEGGGHNICGGEIPRFLASIPKAKWSAYILMERIQPPSVVNILLSSAGLDSGGVVSELAIFRTCLWRRGGGSRCEMLQNEVGGWALKTMRRLMRCVF
ncbi:hypothetical protein ETB97_002381 [Aspergillus alliaceus]|uniref:Glutathione synthetase n=1 Tax=Petromyces alliaceus TaxID=209559 RepID=A0A8H6E567_PETAA|nr:hypothetical protein ETB97_002381 [Aspergillus burnettii]